MLPSVRVVVWLAAAACAVTASAVFAFAHPRSASANQRSVDLAHAHYYSPASVRAAFKAEGISLRDQSTGPEGLLWLSATPLPVPTSGLYVMVGGRTGKVSWGPPTGSGYDHAFGNLDVHYGGTDGHLLAAVEAAVANLQ